jgi:hypothetical protein
MWVVARDDGGQRVGGCERVSKLALRDRTQTAVLAYETGLVRPGYARRPKA